MCRGLGQEKEEIPFSGGWSVWGGLGSPTLLVEEGKMLQGGQNPIWDQVLHPQALLDLGREEGEKKEERGEEGGGDRRWRERTLPPKAPLGLG